MAKAHFISQLHVQILYHNRAIRDAIFRFRLPAHPHEDDLVVNHLQRVFSFLHSTVEKYERDDTQCITPYRIVLLILRLLIHSFNLLLFLLFEPVFYKYTLAKACLFMISRKLLVLLARALSLSRSFNPHEFIDALHLSHNIQQVSEPISNQ